MIPLNKFAERHITFLSVSKIENNILKAFPVIQCQIPHIQGKFFFGKTKC